MALVLSDEDGDCTDCCFVTVRNTFIHCVPEVVDCPRALTAPAKFTVEEKKLWGEMSDSDGDFCPGGEAPLIRSALMPRPLDDEPPRSGGAAESSTLGKGPAKGSESSQVGPIPMQQHSVRPAVGRVRGTRIARGTERIVSVNSRCERLLWKVDTEPLQSNDSVIVSPNLDLDLVFHAGVDKPATFKIMVHPYMGQGFRAARGKFTLSVKLENFRDENNNPINPDTVDERRRKCVWKVNTFPTFEEAMSTRARRQMRGPVKHDFKEQYVSKLPKHMRQDFDVDQDSSSFVVCLEIYPQA